METTLITLPELLKSYVDDVMKSISFEGASSEDRQRFEEYIQTMASEEVMKVLMESLSDSDFDALISAVESGNLSLDDEARLIDESAAKVPDFQSKLVKALNILTPKLFVSAS